MPSTTLHDVAREAGVSIATVSRALNGIASVDPLLVRRVQDAAGRIGYVPNGVGRALKLQRTASWTMIVEGLNAFNASVLEAVEGAAEREGISVFLGITGFDDERERRYVQTAISQRVGGLIVSRASDPDAYRAADLPIVFVDRGFPELGHDSVTVDNRRIGRLAAEHLLEQGFRRIAYIAHDQADSPVAQRAAGLVAALSEHGLGIAPDHRRTTGFTVGDGAEEMTELLGRPDPPDAVFCANGPTTHGAYLSLQGDPRPHPGLVGTDDEEWAALARPSVTVVRQPVAEIGTTAARLLLARRDGGSEPPTDVVLSPELILRESSTRVR